MIPLYFYSFFLVFLLSIRMYHKTISFHSDSPTDPSKISHTESGSNKLPQKRPKSTFSVTLWCFFHFKMKYQGGEGRFSYPWGWDPCALVLVSACCSCNLNSSNNIPKPPRAPNSPRPWSSSAAAAARPVSNAAGETHLYPACLTTAPFLLKRYSSCSFPCQIRTGVDHGSDRAAANRFRSHSLYHHKDSLDAYNYVVELILM